MASFRSSFCYIHSWSDPGLSLQNLYLPYLSLMIVSKVMASIYLLYVDDSQVYVLFTCLLKLQTHISKYQLNISTCITLGISNRVFKLTLFYPAPPTVFPISVSSKSILVQKLLSFLIPLFVLHLTLNMKHVFPALLSK